MFGTGIAYFKAKSHILAQVCAEMGKYAEKKFV